jgi:hypothetical protein
METTTTSPHDGAEPAPDPAVAAALARLTDIDEQPVTEHPAVYSDVHDQLRAALTRHEPGESSG